MKQMEPATAVVVTFPPAVCYTIKVLALQAQLGLKKPDGSLPTAQVAPSLGYTITFTRSQHSDDVICGITEIMRW
jgi:hypothetical protein